MKVESLKHLKGLPLFSLTQDAGIKIIADQLVEESYPAGSKILDKGDTRDSFYIIKSGHVKVIATLENTTDEITLSSLENGDHFGELALLGEEPSFTRITAIDDVEVWKLSKETLDTLILQNPGIKLTMFHLLTQRLKDANVLLNSTEKSTQPKFMPSGEIAKVGILNILKFAENTSLSGKIVLDNENESASFFYYKGQFDKIDYPGKNEDEALDAIQAWNEGHFHIEPDIFETENATSLINATELENPNIMDQPIIVYLNEKFSEIIAFAGPRITQRAVNHAYHSFAQYFDTLDDIKITIEPKLEVLLRCEMKWTDKQSLMVAIILKNVIDYLERDVIGLTFWSPRSQDDRLNEFLESLQYFAFYNEAIDQMGI